LQTDRIDLYQTHFDDEVTPVEETVQAYGELIAAGKVRAACAFLTCWMISPPGTMPRRRKFRWRG
ncbi:MAG: aldo/keto reductase, partial [Pseudolabrys sp.]